MLDMGISLEHVVLQAVELGLGSVWLGLFDDALLRKELEIPDPWRVVAILAIGYPDWPEVKAMTDRIEMHLNKMPLDESCHIGSWGTRLG